LYVPTPAISRNIKRNDQSENGISNENITSNSLSEVHSIQKNKEKESKSKILDPDPFDWKNALETTIPDTTITDTILEEKSDIRDKIPDLHNHFDGTDAKTNDICKISLSALPNNDKTKMKTEPLNDIILLNNPNGKKTFKDILLESDADYSKTPTAYRAPNYFTTPRNQFSANVSPQSYGKKLCTPKLITHKLEFGTLKQGNTKTLCLRICNPGKESTNVSFTVTGCDFLIPIKGICMTARSYFILPVCFVASNPIKPFPNTQSFHRIEERLIIKKDSHNTIRIGLLGEIFIK
jgi:hypothetical protein